MNCWLEDRIIAGFSYTRPITNAVKFLWSDQSLNDADMISQAAIFETVNYALAN